jgi:hypothetical protein
MRGFRPGRLHLARPSHWLTTDRLTTQPLARPSHARGQPGEQPPHLNDGRRLAAVREGARWCIGALAALARWCITLHYMMPTVETDEGGAEEGKSGLQRASASQTISPDFRPTFRLCPRAHKRMRPARRASDSLPIAAFSAQPSFGSLALLLNRGAAAAHAHPLWPHLSPQPPTRTPSRAPALTVLQLPASHGPDAQRVPTRKR